MLSAFLIEILKGLQEDLLLDISPSVSEHDLTCRSHSNPLRCQCAMVFKSRRQPHCRHACLPNPFFGARSSQKRQKQRRKACDVGWGKSGFLHPCYLSVRTSWYSPLAQGQCSFTLPLPWFLYTTQRSIGIVWRPWWVSSSFVSQFIIFILMEGKYVDLLECNSSKHMALERTLPSTHYR